LLNYSIRYAAIRVLLTIFFALLISVGSLLVVTSSALAGTLI
jgi:hypothetical protein